MKVLELFTDNLGILYSILYAIMTTTQANMAKVLTYSSHSSYITFVRSFILVFTLPVSLMTEADESTTYDKTDLGLYLASGVAAIISCATAVISFTLMGVGDSTTIEFGGSLILVGVIGHLVLNEKLSISYFILLLVDCVGIILVAKPSFIFRKFEGEIRSKETGAAVAIIGAFFVCVYQICVRKLEKRNTLQCFLLVAMQGLVGMVVSAVWTTMESAWEIPDTWMEFCIIVGLGLVSILQFAFASKALAIEEASKVAMVLTLSVVLSYVLQITVFEEEVDWISMGGAVIVVLCVILSAGWNYALEQLSGLRHFCEKLVDQNIDMVAP